MERTGVFRRFIAFIIDNILACLTAYAAMFVVMFIFQPWSSAEVASFSNFGQRYITNAAELPTPFVAIILAWFVVYLLYFSLEILLAASLGKLLLGLRIRSEDGSPADFGSLLMRYLVKYGAIVLAMIGFLSMSTSTLVLSGLVNMVVGLGYFMAFGFERQALHDRFANTAVYSKHAEEIISQPRSKELESLVSQRELRRQNAPDPNDLFKPRW